MRAFEFLVESKPGKQAMDYKRSNRYPDGESIPDSLPDRYQPASFPGVPKNEKCSNCLHFDKETRKCYKFKGDPKVRPAYWCAKWEPVKKEITEDADAPKKVGREFNHLEDLVFTEPNGARRAVEILKNMSSDAKDISIKWDGNPTVYWGRDEDGTFRLVGKNNWGREEGKSSSPKELAQFIMSRGKGEDWRPKFANDMAAMWDIFEAATPEDFRGYIYGDILFHPGKPYQGADGKLSFTPNQTTYEVRATSSVGHRIGKAKIAVAAHKRLEFFGDKGGEDISNVKEFNDSPDLVVFGQTYVNHVPAVNADNIGTIEKYTNKYHGIITKLLTPQKGLSDLQTIIYTFVNSQAKAKSLDSLSSDAFFAWLKTSKVSAPKQQRIAELSNSIPEAMQGMFFLIREIMKAKDEVIAELDQAQGDITAHTGGKPGGEGYMHGKHGVKLVPRDRWTPFRAD